MDIVFGKKSTVIVIVHPDVPEDALKGLTDLVPELVEGGKVIIKEVKGRKNDGIGRKT